MMSYASITQDFLTTRGFYLVCHISQLDPMAECEDAKMCCCYIKWLNKCQQYGQQVGDLECYVPKISFCCY